MERETIRVLLVEDNPEDAQLIRDLLSEELDSHFEVTYADQLSTGLEVLATERFDVLLLDLELSDSEGFTSFRKVQLYAPELPIVVLTGLDDETLATTAVREGVQDYLIKGSLNRRQLERSIRYAIERKQSEEALRDSKSKIQGILAAMADLVFVFDGKTRFRFYHAPSSAELYVPPDTFMGKKVSDVVPPHVARLFSNAFATNKNGERSEFEYWLSIESETRWYSAILSPMFRNDQFKGAVAVIRNITERKCTEKELQKHRDQLEVLVNERTQELREVNEQLRKEIAGHQRAEEQLHASLTEKELLLKEIHHRVKNNLQIISSLLHLQARSVHGNDVLEPLQETQHRVQSMALVHERLYRAENLTQIDFARYIEELAKGLFFSYQIDRSAIRLKTDVNASLDINAAIPCGLIINELISNALKHAFPGGRTGEIAISLRSNSEPETAGRPAYRLTIRDNGIGLPKELELQNTQTLGLQLVCGLVKQLDGTIELNRNGGTAFTITFAAPEQRTLMRN